VLRRCWRSLRGTLRGQWRAGDMYKTALNGRLRLGIGARLGIAFAAVGALVLAANFIVEKGVLIERTTNITRTLPPADGAPTPIVMMPAPSVAPTPAIVIPPRQTFTSGALLLTRDRFDEAVLERVAANSEPADAKYRLAAADMNRAANVFMTTAASISGKSFVRVGAAFKIHQREGDSLILMSDDRRDMILKYVTLFEALSARDKNSLDGSWKIFGRVVARQSLLQLNADLDALRRHATAFSSAENSDALEITALLQAEQALQKLLDENHKGLRRSEGDAWYEAMYSDFTAFVATRASIVQANEQLRDRSQEFSQHGAILTKTVPSKVESPAEDLSRVAKNKAIRRGSDDPSSQAAPLPTASTPEAVRPAVIETHSVVTEAPQDRSRRVEIAWISAGSLVLLIYILVGTVLSIIRPVRRLLSATALLAGGDTDARVPRGGIKELDTVAVAFNAMAEDLSSAKATARGYQQSLELKVAERTLQLRELAERDPLTGLPNRREWFVLLHAAIERALAAGTQVGVFFLDIDNFKYINDSKGHAFGDRVLVSLAERLQSSVQAFGLAARWGGDEFTVIFPGAQSSEKIRAAGISIVQAFQQPLTVDNRELVVSVSVGASIYPDHEQEAEALLKAADVALFRAKELGRCQLSMFTPEMLKTAEANFSTEQGLRRAIERGEFELVFQPEISVENLETALVEALIRWRMPDGSLASPCQFLAIAEESGLILEIGDWVLRSAIEAAADWHHGAWPEVRVAINVSARQFIDAGFIDRLQSLLRTYRLPPQCIEIELTESVLQTGPSTIDALKRLRALGVAIALDDFGTGYSSLASLVQLPLTRIKLDRSLVSEIDNSPRSAAMAHAIIAMCQGLGLEITAEGIERPEQFAMLMKHRGMYLQGYLLGHPTSRVELLSEMANVAQRSRELLLSSQAQSPSNVVELVQTPCPYCRKPGEHEPGTLRSSSAEIRSAGSSAIG
jgi:diguanylate cyclase (GGDEF)-like protein